MFRYRVIGDGPHRPDRIYLVMDSTLFTSGQCDFGQRRKLPMSMEPIQEMGEQMPPLQFIFEDKNKRCAH